MLLNHGGKPVPYSMGEMLLPYLDYVRCKSLKIINYQYGLADYKPISHQLLFSACVPE
jgi:hypothetical protein